MEGISKVMGRDDQGAFYSADRLRDESLDVAVANTTTNNWVRGKYLMQSRFTAMPFQSTSLVRVQPGKMREFPEEIWFGYLFIYFLVGGRGGNASCTLALVRRVWDSGTACRWVNLPVGHPADPTLPTKTLPRR